MFTALLFLVLLIVTTPIFLIFDGPIVHGLVIEVAAVSVAIVGIRIRPGEAGHLSSVIRPMAIVAALPALWMLVQLLPLKATIGLRNPIWDSASAALGRPLSGGISIDPGATLIALAQYLSTLAIVFVAAALAIDRHRAEWILFALMAATTLIAAMVLAGDLGGYTFLSTYDGGPVADAATDSASLGAIIAAAAAFHTFKRADATSPGHGGATLRFPVAFATCLIAVAICSLAVFVNATSPTYFAVICGAATLAVVIAIRRFRVGPWGYSAIASVAVVVVIAVVALQPVGRTVDLTLAFAGQAPGSLIALTQRILAETNWAGTGAGSFSAILPIYQDIDELATGSVAPTAAAGIAVEMGRPFLWALVIAAIALVLTLIRGAVRRGRDSIYSMAGASCAVATTLLAFGNIGIFSTPVMVIAATAVGIAIAQRKSRSI
jgi:hypothetical protein